MKIFQLLDLIIKLFRLNKDKKAKVIIFGLLSYHAQVQSQMASAFWLGTSEVIEIPCDDDYDKVSLLLHMDGTNTSTVFLDNSVNDFIVTPSGNARISNAQSVFGGTSASFDGTGDFLTITSNTAFNYSTGDFTIEGWIRNAAATTTRRTIFSQSSGTSVSGLIIETYATGIETNRVYFGGYSSGTAVFNLTSIEIAASTWFHFAAVKSGTTYSLYINGVLQQSSTTATVIPYDNKNVVIGALTDNTGRDYFGFIDEVRITKGVARYTSNFTVPTAAFENADCPGSTGISVDYLVVAGGGGGGRVRAGGGGAGGYRSSVSGEISGGGSQHETPLSLQLGSSYNVVVGEGGAGGTLATSNKGLNGSNSIFNTIISIGGGGGASDGVVGNTGGSGGGSGYNAASRGLGTASQGYDSGIGVILTEGIVGGGGGGAGELGSTDGKGHGGDGLYSSITGTSIAYAGGGGGGSSELNSIALGGIGGGGNGGSRNTDNDVPGTPNTGGGGGGGCSGNIAFDGSPGGSGVVIIRFDSQYDVITTSGNLVLEKSIVGTDRVVKFTSGSGTIEFVDATCDEYYYSNSLLLHMDGANNSTTFTDNSINNFTVTPFGNAQISTAESKFGGASGYFDGSGDFIEVGNSQEFNMGSGDFTIEGWINLNNKTTTQGLIYFTNRTVTGAGVEIAFAVEYVQSSDAFRGFVYVSGTIYQVINTTPVSANTWYHLAFVRSGNTLNFFVNGVSTGTTTMSGVLNYKTGFTVNNVYFNNDLRLLNGYIDDIRITKGVARYTSNFTPPTAPFEDVSCNPIVSDNLIAYYDASNPESYPGTGTTWFDLSGNNYDLTLTGPTYLSDNGGVFDFDGVNDYALYNTGDIAQDVYSIQMWMKADNQFASSGTRQTLFYSDPSSGTIYASNLQIGQVYNASSQFTNVALQSGVAAYGNDIRTGAGVANIWYNITVLFDGTTNGFDFYVNGSKISDNVIAQGTGRITKLKNILVGATNTSGLQSLNGKIGEFYIYKRKLTESEILLNYNNTKVRYSSSGPVWDGSQTGILDNYPGAAAAYSVRALNSNYTGPLMTIRRASDNAEIDVYALANGDLDQAWINTFCSGTTCTVRTWYDQSGNGRNATQTTSTSQPIIYQSNATLLSNSKPAVFFNSDILQLPNSLIVTSPSTIITVYDWESASGGAALINYRSNPLDDPELRYGPGAGSIAFYWNGQYFVNPLTTTTTQTLVALSFTGSTTATMYVDGSSSRSDFKTGPLSTGSPVVPFTFGYYSLVNNYANGYIQEFILYNSDVLFNNAEIRTNINSYYSIY